MAEKKITPLTSKEIFGDDKRQQDIELFPSEQYKSKQDKIKPLTSEEIFGGKEQAQKISIADGVEKELSYYQPQYIPSSFKKSLGYAKSFFGGEAQQKRIEISDALKTDPAKFSIPMKDDIDKAMPMQSRTQNIGKMDKKALEDKEAEENEKAVQSLIDKLPRGYIQSEENGFSDLPEDNKARLMVYLNWKKEIEAAKKDITPREKILLQQIDPDIYSSIFSRQPLSKVGREIEQGVMGIEDEKIFADENDRTFAARMEKEYIDALVSSGEEDKVEKILNEGGLFYKNRKQLENEYKINFSLPGRVARYSGAFAEGVLMSAVKSERGEFGAYDNYLYTKGITDADKNSDPYMEISNLVGSIAGDIALTIAGSGWVTAARRASLAARGSEKLVHNLALSSQRYGIREMMKTPAIIGDMAKHWGASGVAFATASTMRRALDDFNEGKQAVIKEYGELFYQNLMMAAPFLLKSWWLGFGVNAGLSAAFTYREFQKDGNIIPFASNILMFALFDAISRKAGWQRVGIGKNEIQLQINKIKTALAKEQKRKGLAPFSEKQLTERANRIYAQFTYSPRRDQSVASLEERNKAVARQYKMELDKVKRQYALDLIENKRAKNMDEALVLAGEYLKKIGKEIDMKFSYKGEAKIPTRKDVQKFVIDLDGGILTRDSIYAMTKTKKGIKTKSEDGLDDSMYDKIEEVFNQHKKYISNQKKKDGELYDKDATEEIARGLAIDKIKKIIDPEGKRLTSEARDSYARSFFDMGNIDAVRGARGIRTMRAEDIDDAFLAANDVFALTLKPHAVSRKDVIASYIMKRLVEEKPYIGSQDVKVYFSPRGEILFSIRKSFNNRTGSNDIRLMDDVRSIINNSKDENIGKNIIGKVVEIDNYPEYLNMSSKIDKLASEIEPILSSYKAGIKEIEGMKNFNDLTDNGRFVYSVITDFAGYRPRLVLDKMMHAFDFLSKYNTKQSSMREFFDAFDPDKFTDIKKILLSRNDKDRVYRIKRLKELDNDIDMLVHSTTDDVVYNSIYGDTAKKTARMMKDVAEKQKKMSTRLERTGMLDAQSAKIFNEGITDLFYSLATINPSMRGTLMRAADLQLARQLGWIARFITVIGRNVPIIQKIFKGWNKVWEKVHFEDENVFKVAQLKYKEMSDELLRQQIDRLMFGLFPEGLRNKQLHDAIMAYEMPKDLFDGGTAALRNYVKVVGGKEINTLLRENGGTYDKRGFELLVDQVKIIEDLRKGKRPDGNRAAAIQEYRDIRNVREKSSLFFNSLVDFMNTMFPTSKVLADGVTPNPRYSPLNEIMQIKRYKQMEYGEFADNTRKSILATVDTDPARFSNVNDSAFMKKLEYISFNLQKHSTPSTELRQDMMYFSMKDFIEMYEPNIRREYLAKSNEYNELIRLKKSSIKTPDTARRIKEIEDGLSPEDMRLLGKINDLIETLNTSTEVFLKQRYVPHLLYREGEFLGNEIVPPNITDLSIEPLGLTIKRELDTFNDLLTRNIRFNKNIFEIMTRQFVYTMKKVELFNFYRTIADTDFVRYDKTVGGKKGMKEIRRGIDKLKEKYDSLEEKVIDLKNKGVKEIDPDLIKKRNVARRDWELAKLDESQWVELHNVLSTPTTFNIKPGDTGYIRADMYAALASIKESETPLMSPLERFARKVWSFFKARQFYMALRQSINNSFQLFMAGDYETYANMNKGFLTWLYMESHSFSRPGWLKMSAQKNNQRELSLITGKMEKMFDNRAWVEKNIDMDGWLELQLLNGFSEGSGNPMREMKELSMATMKSLSYSEFKKNQTGVDALMYATKKKFPSFFQETTSAEDIFKKTMNIILIQDFYTASSDFAWGMDRVFRFSMWRGLKAKGYNSQEAARLMQLYMADYDSLPGKTKRLMNWFFFVPNYKSQTLKIWAKMIGEATTDMRMFRTLMFTGITIGGIEVLMNYLGFVPQKKLGFFAYRFFMETQGGQIKAVSVSSPVHEPAKWLHNGIRRYLSYQIHPSIGMIINAGAGLDRFGRRVFEDYEPFPTKAMKYLWEIHTYLQPWTQEISQTMPAKYLGYSIRKTFGSMEDFYEATSEQTLSVWEVLINQLGIANIYFLNEQAEEYMHKYNTLRRIPNKTPAQMEEMKASLHRARNMFKKRDIQSRIININDIGTRSRAEELFKKGRLTDKLLREMERSGR